MTHLQQKTIDEMMRQGLHTELYTATRCWRMNTRFNLSGIARIPGLLKDLIEKSNMEIERRH